MIPAVTLLVATLGCGPSGAELRYPTVTADLMARVDADGDGQISQTEFDQLALPDEPFGPLDLDTDGALSPVELEQALLRSSPSVSQQRGRRAVHEKYGPPFVPPPGRRGAPPPQSGPAPQTAPVPR